MEVDAGLLQEVNRLVFHVMGLALVERQGLGLVLTEAPLTHCLPAVDKHLAEDFRVRYERRLADRREALGFGIQPAGDALVVGRIRL